MRESQVMDDRATEGKAMRAEWLFPAGLGLLSAVGLFLWAAEGPRLAGQMLFGFCL